MVVLDNVYLYSDEACNATVVYDVSPNACQIGAGSFAGQDFGSFQAAIDLEGRLALSAYATAGCMGDPVASTPRKPSGSCQTLDAFSWGGASAKAMVQPSGSPAASPTPRPKPDPIDDGADGTTIGLAIGGSAMLVAALVVFAILFLRRRRKQTDYSSF